MTRKKRAAVTTTPAKGIPIAAGGSVLRPLKAAEVVARDVVRDITAKGLQPGDCLPSEAQMLQTYGVSRESLREGLRLLEVQGMISIRRGPGGGPIVGTVDSANLGRMEALFYHLAGATYDELFEAWLFAESTLARLAATNPDAALREQVMEPYLSGDVEDAEHEDLEVYLSGHEGFHGAVSGLTGNRVFQLTFRAYGQVVAHHLSTVGDVHVRKLHRKLADDHLKLAQAIVDGNGDLASTLMHDHLSEVIAITRRELGSLLEGPVGWL
ncbi:GntR family transcriptional regulator [Rhodococcus pyridinivorans KG-16]|uniref:GntR family transcriptional regulator n=2 Tax=Rhodococcus pyridinivorans TaxID=103816 RepID=A0A0V9UCZ1_9NOCA|nr:GntR family transcriptional regulator [Rhodococcus pyridinivorans KG-16]